MNRATTTQRIETVGILSLALLISLTSDGSHRSDHSANNRTDALIRASPNCAETPEPQDIVVVHGLRETGHSCVSELEASQPQPIRLVTPLPGSQHLRPGDSTRYSF